MSHNPDFVEPVPDIAAQYPFLALSGFYVARRLESQLLFAGRVLAATRFQVPGQRSSARDNRETSAVKQDRVIRIED